MITPDKNKILFIYVLLIFFIFTSFTNVLFAESCPKKIKWKKLRTEDEVKTVLYKCLPVKTAKSEITTFLSLQKVEYSDDEENIIFFSVLTKSNSIWIEKKWAIRLVLDENHKLKDITVEQWLTGP